MTMILMFVGVLMANAESRWINITDSYFANPSFDKKSSAEWTIEGSALSLGAINYGCIEMWWGTMKMSTHISVPAGSYRISIQALHRTYNHQRAYVEYNAGTASDSAFFMISGATAVKCNVPSVYTYAFTEKPHGNSYQPDKSKALYYADSMEAAEEAFNIGAYTVSLTVEAGDDGIDISLWNITSKDGNWLVIDNVKVEMLSTCTTPEAGSLIINEVMASNVDTEMSPACNFDGWIELYNPTSDDISLGGCCLTDSGTPGQAWILPEALGVVKANGWKRIWMGSNGIRKTQSAIKLSPEGGKLTLTTRDGKTIDSVTYPMAIGRCSWARKTDGEREWGFTADPTPDATNTTSEYATQQLPDPEVTPDGQLFDGQLLVMVNMPTGTVVRYTLDNTTPTMTNGHTSTTGLFTIKNTTTLKVRLFANGMLPSEVVTRAYVERNYDFTLPVIMVNTKDEYLYDDKIGVYTKGTNGRTGNGQSTPANWNMDWDRPVNFQFLLPDGTMALNQDVDFAISGGWTRANTLKSFKLKAGRVYQNKNSMDYPFFSAKPYLKNKTLQIRMGGNDSSCRIKDAAIQTIIQRSGINMDVISYEPAVHFINGVYKGLINIREPNNKDFAYANFGYSKDEIDVFENSPDSGRYMMYGTDEALLQLEQLSEKAYEEETYEEIKKLIDIDEYINYMAAEMFLGSWDWPDNNVKGYRKRDNGRYRIVMFDMDAAFETDSREKTENPDIAMNGNFFYWLDGMQWHTFDYVYDTASRMYGEIKFCTFFFNMLKNDDFRKRFIDTFCIMGGSVFNTTKANAILTELAVKVRQTMEWEQKSPYRTIDAIKSALNGRVDKMAKNMNEYERFGLTEQTPYDIEIKSDIDHAHLYINDTPVPYSLFRGKLFLPTTLKADDCAGYIFQGWKRKTDNGSESIITTEKELEITDTEKATFTACYAKAADSNIVPVRINEVSAANSIYVNEYYKRNDWIELYNTTDSDIDTEGMYLTDNPNTPTKYRITKENTGSNTILPAHGFMIVWCDNLSTDAMLHSNFKLSAEGGTVMLSASDMSWSDKMVYSAHNGDETIVRYPDGTDNVYLTNIPTIEKKNIWTSYLVNVEQSPTGITSRFVSDNNGLKIFYSSRCITVMSEDKGDVRIDIYTATGQKVETIMATAVDGKTEKSVALLPEGIYVARATDGDGKSAACKFAISN